jgi:uncharacterized protein YegP (UPF0339 family)
MQDINLNKRKWTDSDFDIMQWHDCKVYAIAFDSEKFELLFDIDFIVEWKKPKNGGSFFKFWVVPATLVFKHVYDISINTDSVDLIIQDIIRNNPSELKNENYQWKIETTNGEIIFKSLGYEQFARKKPVLLDTQAIGLIERNGLSFDKATYQS